MSMRPRGGPMRLEKTLRGMGQLSWGRRQVRSVAYAIDFYSQGKLRNAAGDVRGDLAEIENRRPITARLHLQDGQDLTVILSDIEADSANVEVRLV